MKNRIVQQRAKNHSGIDEEPKIETSPSKPQEFRQNQKNNLWVLLNEAWVNQVPGFDVKEPGKAATAILDWAKTNGMRSVVEHRTLKGYVEELAEAIKQFDAREKLSLSRMDVDRAQS